MKICFAASSGGHLEQILMLTPMMRKYESFILTEKTKYNLNSEFTKIYYVNQINRREFFFLFKLLSVIIMTFRIFLIEKPDVVISTGALATIPICIIAKVTKRKLIFIESFSKVNSPTLTGKIMYKFADLFLIQWEELKKYYPNAKFGGGIY